MDSVASVASVASVERVDPASDPAAAPSVAFVLGGGGVLGGYQVGMLRALFERDVKPDLIVGTSIGSFQGAMLAANPTPSVCVEMAEMWGEFVSRKVMKVSARSLASNLSRLRPTLTTNERLRTLLEERLGARTRIEDLAVPYQCVAASIERATVRYFDSGALVPAVMASAAVPGLWPPIKIGDEHYIDGGVVESVPMTRAVAWGATTVYVLRMRQQEAPLRPARWPWQLGGVVFEVSRRHRMGHMLNSRPEGVAVHVLPSGEDAMDPPDHGSRSNAREELQTIRRRIEQGYRSASEFLDAEAKHRRYTGKSANPAVSVHAAARLAESASGRNASSAKPLSPFVLSKLRAYFAVFDRDHDGKGTGVGTGVVTRMQYGAVADRIVGAFDLDASDERAQAVWDAYATNWDAMCAAVGADPAAGLDRDQFGHALTELTADQVAYTANMLPVLEAILDVADVNGDQILSPTEVRRLLPAFGVDEHDAASVARRLDTNGDGVISLDELSEAFRDYFTSDEPGCVGNQIFGRLAERGVGVPA